MNGELDEVTSFGDCAGIPMDVGPVCESCGVPLVEHLGLIRASNACAYRPSQCDNSDLHAHYKGRDQIMDAIREGGA